MIWQAMSADRDLRVTEFLRRCGWGDAKRWLLAGDASFRRYDRLEKSTGRAVFMDAPPPQEDVRPFVRIAQHLFEQGFSTPKILAADVEAGFLLLEDLGDDTYTNLLTRGYDERELYALATDTLIALHRLPENKAVPEGVKTYGMPRLLEEVGRLHKWYLPLVEAPPLSTTAIGEFESIWDSLFPLAWKAPSSLILFDYHVDNLLLISERSGIKACGLLDFQDAVTGPVTYDLMSLLEDARRDLGPGLIADMRQKYLAAFPALSLNDFDTSWAVMAAQRHVRVIGTFARLKLRDNKSQYLQHMPRLWRYMDQCLAHPTLNDLKNWFDVHVPQTLRVART
jgi:aminoglycoside/choline kinase family phosphotransferase